MNNIFKKYPSICICLILVLITTAVFYPICTYDFINYDDPAYVYENPNIQSGITLKAVKWAFSTGYTANWHPLTWLSHMLDWQLFHSRPAGHHLTNLIFHIANTILLFIILKQMTHKLWPSAFVAALFAIHPLHVESVAWVAERKDVLSTFFWMLTMLAYLRFVKYPNIINYLLTLMFFALGLMAKPMLVTLPFVLLLLDYWPLARLPSQQTGGKTDKLNKKYTKPSFDRKIFCNLIQEKIPFFILAAVSSVVTFFVQQSGGAMTKLVILPLRFRIFNVLISYISYIWKMIWPVHLAVFYPHPDQKISILYVIISAVFLLTITFLIYRFSRYHQYLVTGWFWYLGTLVPVIGIVQVGRQAIADRYTYVPLIGLFIILAWWVPNLLEKWRYKKIALTVSPLLIILALSICTSLQLRHWQNSLVLFQHALNVTEDNFTTRLHIAESFYEENRLDEAVREYHKCLQMIPDDPEAHNNLGISLGKQGKLDEAIKCFTEALRIKPDFAAANDNMGYAMVLQGNIDDAAAYFAEALRINPNLVRPHYYYGKALVQKGKIVEAVTHFEEALRLGPDWIEPMNDLAWFLATSKEAAIYNPGRAVILAQQACKLTGYKQPDLLDTLAAAYAAAGDFSKAIEIAEKALELCQSPEQITLKQEVESRLALYKAGKPYTEAQ